MIMKSNRRIWMSCLAWLGGAALAGWTGSAAEPYRDASVPIEQRVEDLLGRMTLEEKIGQMNMPCVYEGGLGKTIPAKTEAVQKFAAGTYVKEVALAAVSSRFPTRFCTKGPGSRPSF